MFTEGAYFIGKLLWAKGHGLLIDYLAGEEVSLTLTLTLSLTTPG